MTLSRRPKHTGRSYTQSFNSAQHVMKMNSALERNDRLSEYSSDLFLCFGAIFYGRIARIEGHRSAVLDRDGSSMAPSKFPLTTCRSRLHFLIHKDNAYSPGRGVIEGGGGRFETSMRTLLQMELMCGVEGQRRNCCSGTFSWLLVGGSPWDILWREELTREPMAAHKIGVCRSLQRRYNGPRCFPPVLHSRSMNIPHSRNELYKQSPPPFGHALPSYYALDPEHINLNNGGIPTVHKRTRSSSLLT